MRRESGMFDYTIVARTRASTPVSVAVSVDMFPGAERAHRAKPLETPGSWVDPVDLDARPRSPEAGARA